MEALVVGVLVLCALMALLTRLDGSVARSAVPDPLHVVLRALEGGDRLRLVEVAAGQGLGRIVNPDSESSLRKAAHAARRCVFCPEHARCDTLIARNGWTALRRICPNSAYIDGLRQHAA